MTECESSSDRVVTVPFSVLPLAKLPTFPWQVHFRVELYRPAGRLCDRLIACRGYWTERLWLWAPRLLAPITIHHHRAGRSPLPGSPTRPKAEGTIGTTVSVATGSARILEARTHQPDARDDSSILAGWLVGLSHWSRPICPDGRRKNRGPRVRTRRLLGCPHGRVSLAPGGRAYSCLDQPR
jgi:hypothetical protein